MTTRKVPLTDLQKESFGLLYYNVKNALELCETIRADDQIDGYIKHRFIRKWRINIGIVKDELDLSLGCNDLFADQIKNTDTQGLSDVISGYIAMSPEGREAVEQLFSAIKNNEEIKVEVV